MEKITACPVCKGTGWEEALICEDYTVSREHFSIVQCKDCSFLFTNPRPGKEQIGRYYQSPDYISHSDSSKGIVNRIYKLVRHFTVRSKYQLIKPYLTKATLLDIGAGTGFFLKFCQEKGLRVWGVEPDADARLAAARLHHLELSSEDALSEFPAGSFPVITMWHVLEHVHDLENRIREVQKLLMPGGKLIVAVPNHLSHDARYYGKYWAAYDVPRHLYHFDPNSIRNLFSSHGFKLENIVPMRWDAYYVSMLSERYKNGAANFPGALFRGFISNLRAKSGEYSSQIYVLSKNTL